MNAAPGGTTFSNVAGGDSDVGFQAQTVHIDSYYQVADDDPPERQFEVGLRYLEIGAPVEARKLITKAVARGYTSSRAHFYLLLALLSGRTVQTLTDEELAQLKHIRRWAAGRADDQWVRGVTVVVKLLESLPRSTAESGDPAAVGIVVKEFETLGPLLQEGILRHLEVFLAGPQQDWTWKKAFATARRDRMDNDRTERVWKYFQPKPIPPRVAPPYAERIAFGDVVRAYGGIVLLLLAGSAVVQPSWATAPFRTVGYLLLVIGAAVVAVRAGFEFRLARYRRLLAIGRLVPTPRRETPEADRFASAMTSMFDRYFQRYVPAGAEREVWLADTAGIRQHLRDELVDLYREQRVDARRVAWLVRFLVGDVKRQWQSGELWSRPEQFRVPFVTRAAFAGAVAVFALVGASLAWPALVEAPLMTTIMMVGVFAGARLAVRGWLTITLEKRRCQDDLVRAEQERGERQAAYERWLRKLESKPSDAEMAHWLDCDRKALVEDALRHYRVAAQDVIAHAFIEAPVPRCKRARVSKGPWRYSRYKLLVFLLTRDGVRQVTVSLDFETARFGDQQRLTYQYGSVVAAHVVDARNGEKRLSLTLTNNPRDELTITGEWPGMPEYGEDDRVASQVSLDASGLDRTLHVLEGIAAEGKQWITHENRREQAGLRRLLDGMDG
jgi:hypothetical protein